MKDRKTSRVLNDDSYFLGLSYNDITGAGLLLLVLIILFKILEIKSTIWALFATAISIALLIPIRLSFRRKIIRDSIKYFLRNGVIRVSKNYRNK